MDPSGVPTLSASAPRLIPAVDNTLGAFLVGTSISLLLYGLLVHQVFHYFRTFHDDKSFLKKWVHYHLAYPRVTSSEYLFSKYIPRYHYTITNWANPFILVEPFQPIVKVLPAVAVKFLDLFQALTPLSVEIPLVVIASAFVLGFYDLQAYISFKDPTSWLSGIGGVSLEVGDLITSSTLVYVLYKSRCGMRRTDSIIEMLIKYTVTTGMLLCICSSVTIAMDFRFSENMIGMSADVVITMGVFTLFSLYERLNSQAATVHACVFLAALNSRSVLTSLDNAPTSVSKPQLDALARSARSEMVFRTPERRAEDSTKHAFGGARSELTSIAPLSTVVPFSPDETCGSDSKV
ncbi:uncharacterized protein BXZ73DRAFT_76335 [Epithele typhae]|uniref:uncharacterized protein n=1 Tax=Epithele typhae TaxID=378194 RepID=UPI00200733C0|nr:uncharacterized protein BXZ73DRAFT_76335 [Epithele typhae]KAH9938832.1 hypothetical protein BXZ73DRAFT_76335 [Epithele typhae]